MGPKDVMIILVGLYKYYDTLACGYLARDQNIEDRRTKGLYAISFASLRNKPNVKEKIDVLYREGSFGLTGDFHILILDLLSEI